MNPIPSSPKPPLHPATTTTTSPHPPGGRLPSFLDPVGCTRELGIWTGHQLNLEVSEFARHFRVEPDLALVALLAGAAHCLGGSVQWRMPWGRIRPPFNVLLITPEPDPLWVQVPLRFLRDDLPEEMLQLIQLPQTHVRRNAPHPDPTRQPHPPTDQDKPSQNPRQSASKQEPTPMGAQTRQLIAPLYRESVAGPFPPCLLDGQVTLATPRSGLVTALKRLTELERLHLEASLLGGRELMAPAPTQPAGHGSFLWHCPTHQVGDLFGHQGWLARIPFLMMQSHVPGFPHLEENGLIATHQRRCRELFRTRFWTQSVRTLELSRDDQEPVMRFLHDAQVSESRYPDPYAALWVAELGLKLTLILMRIRGHTEPGPVGIQNGLDLAKRWARIHYENLAAYRGVVQNRAAENAALTERERAVYLRIVEQGRIRKADLRKGFHRMAARERDELVAGLLTKGLIRQDGDYLRQRAA